MLVKRLRNGYELSLLNGHVSSLQINQERSLFHVTSILQHGITSNRFIIFFLFFMASDPVLGDDTPRHSSTFWVDPSRGSGSAVSHTIHSFSKHDTIKLTESNFLLWKYQILLIIEGYDLEGFV